MPMLLAVGAIHHDLIRPGLRMQADLVCETGEVWDVHHLACLIGYGASAVHPYLALTAAAELGRHARVTRSTTADELQRNYITALEYGMLKIASKMGISTAMGYRGAQIFEAIGLDQALVERYFTGTPSRLGGIGLTEIETDVLPPTSRGIRRRRRPSCPIPVSCASARTARRTPSTRPLPKSLQAAATTSNVIDFQAYRDLVKEHPLTAVRDLIELKPLGEPVSARRGRAGRRHRQRASSSPRCRSARSARRPIARWRSA